MTTHGDLIAGYLADPTPASLAELRRAVRSARNFQPDLAVEEVIHPLMEQGSYDAAVTALQNLMPGAMFSPSVHAALAEALTGAGRRDAARRELSLARAAIRSILSTGDGTVERPWSVLRVSDEYDVLRALEKAPRQQSVDRHGDRYLDHHACADGSDVYFDVTALFPRS